MGGFGLWLGELSTSGKRMPVSVLRVEALHKAFEGFVW